MKEQPASPKLTLAQLLEEQARFIAELHAAQEQLRDDYKLSGPEQVGLQKEQK